MKLLLAFALLLPMLSYAQVKNSLVGFQGIPWGSSMSAVKAKVPQVKEIDYCKAFDKFPSGGKTMKQRFQEEDSNCIHLYAENYNVSAGVNYDLAFYFNQAGRLEQVTLSKYFKQEANPGYLSDCSAMYDRTGTLLTINYGNGAEPSNLSQFKSSYNNVTGKLWVPMPTEIFLKKQSGFKLSQEENKSDLCQVEVMYSPRSANKL